MAEKSDDFEIKLSEEDSLTDILVEPGDTELLDDDQITDDSSEWLAESDLDDMYTESEELDSEPDEEPIDLGMDEIGNLVEDLKMDFQQEETDESVNGEKDMVFEEEETEEESSDSVESLLDELDGDESEENSDSDDSFVDDIDGEIDKALDVVEPEESDDAEISGESTEEVEELDLSEDLDPEELKDSSGETDAVEESVESLSAEEADTESSEVLEMLHDPEISEDSEDSEANDTEDLELGIDALDDIKDSEEADTELVDIGESKIDELKFDNETEENSASETSADSPEENEVTGAQMDSSDSVEVEPEIEKTPVIEKVESKMPIEIEASETSAVPLDADMLLKFHHEAVVEIARTQLTGEEITQITYGSIIELDKVAGEPVNLVLDGKTIALGEVIQINNDKLGIRIVGIVQE